MREQEILGEELALTGCPDQTFSQHASKPCLAASCLQKAANSRRGPAILIYYGPALMQKAGAADPYNTMRILVESRIRAPKWFWSLGDLPHCSSTLALAGGRSICSQDDDPACPDMKRRTKNLCMFSLTLLFKLSKLFLFNLCLLCCSAFASISFIWFVKPFPNLVPRH